MAALIFFGEDVNKYPSLWSSSGTGPTTQQIDIPNSQQDNLQFSLTSNLLKIGSKIYFSGDDSNNLNQLFAASSTFSQVSEVSFNGGPTNIFSDPTYFGSMQPTFVNFGGKATFLAGDSSGDIGLWQTNGTVAGTVEVAQMQNIGLLRDDPGLRPSPLVVSSGEVFFQASYFSDGDSLDGLDDLWVSNGTTGGTTPLTSVAGAFRGDPGNGGLLYETIPDFTAFDGRTYFEGNDAAGDIGLWVTNGTNLGTTELTGIPGAQSGFLRDGDPDFTAFDGKLYFQALGSDGFLELWASDGTAAGTHQLMGIGNTENGLFGQIAIGTTPDFTVLNGELLFKAVDSSGVWGFWVTTGTGTGTHELTGIIGAGDNGIFSNATPDFTVVGNSAFFEGVNSTGQVGLWVTDGTAKGTHEVTGIDGAASSGVDPSDFLATTQALPRDDFNDAGVSDLLMESSTRAVENVQVGVGGRTTYTLMADLGSTWTLKGNGDFLADGDDQFLMENTAGALDAIQFVSGAASYKLLADLGGSAIKETGDFLGAGHDQILIQEAGGLLLIGNLVGGKEAFTSIGPLGSQWSFGGAGDYLGEGHDQFLIEDAAGSVLLGDVKSGKTTYTNVTTLASGWKLLGTGSFLDTPGAGASLKSDFLVEAPTGAIYAAEVGPSNAASFTHVTTLASQWTFVGAGDYLGEGHDQFLVENTAGAVLIGDFYGGVTHFALAGDFGSQWTFHN